jgi:hypothetical protein
LQQSGWIALICDADAIRWHSLSIEVALSSRPLNAKPFGGYQG